jgi:hypothetical protein
MKGLQLLLQSMGIKIDPIEIENAFQRGKKALPEIAQAFDDLKAAQKRIEEKLDALIDWRRAQAVIDDSPEIIERIKAARAMNGPAHNA